MPPVGTKRRPGNGAAMAVSMASPPSGLGREELDEVEAQPSGAHEVARGGAARQAGDPGGQGPSHDVFVDARADDEAGPGVDGGVDLRRQQHRAGADEDVRVGVGGGADGIRRGSGAEGELRDGQPAVPQRPGQGRGVGRVIDDDDRHDAQLGDRSDQLTSMPPPSSGDGPTRVPRRHDTREPRHRETR